MGILVGMGTGLRDTVSPRCVSPTETPEKPPFPFPGSTDKDYVSTISVNKRTRLPILNLRHGIHSPNAHKYIQSLR